MPFHWHKPSPKQDWADDIRDDLRALLPDYPDKLDLPSLDKMKRGDLMMLAQAMTDILAAYLKLMEARVAKLEPTLSELDRKLEEFP